MAKKTDEDIPRFVRRCWDRYQEATTELREKEKESIGFWIGGDFQWNQGDLNARRSNGRPVITINRCKPAVDQIENESRNNPIGPSAIPLSGGATAESADILEGMVREYEYRSDAENIDALAIRMACAGGRGGFEMATEFAQPRSREQQIIIKPMTDPALYFYDPDASGPNLEDSMWGGKLRKMSREQLTEAYPGKDFKVFDASFGQRAMGWMADAFGWSGDATSRNIWTGGVESKGPYYVCEFYRVMIDDDKCTAYDNGINYYDDEIKAGAPGKAKPKLDDEGEEISWTEPHRQVKKYVVTALDTIVDTDWFGDCIPHFWVLGPEMWRDGKRTRLSALTHAQDAQQGLNFTATSAAEVTGTMAKSPIMGFEGQFDVVNAQGINKWDNQSGAMYNYMEVKAKFAIDPTTGQASLLPLPQRNTWEAPIQRVLELATFFAEQIKAATSVFFEPSIRSAQAAQSGSAIKALQAQTNIGTGGWQKSLQRAKTLSYQQAALILPQLYDGQRVRMIIRPDSQAEMVEINKEFAIHEVDQQTGKKKLKDGKTEHHNNITRGKYAIRVEAGPNFKDRADESAEKVTEIIKVIPNILGNPAAQAQFIRWVGQGDPDIEALADNISPDPTKTSTPEQMQQQLAQLGQENTLLKQGLQKLSMALQAKLPEIEAKKWQVAVNAIAGIREAEIKAGVDRAQMDLDALEHLTGMAHETAMQATDQQHQQGMQANQQVAAAQTQGADQAHQQQMAQQAQESQGESDNG